MKKKNFPQRKQARRQSARDRLVKKWLSSNDKLPHSVTKEMLSLDKSLEQGDLRSVRTKKYRGG